MRGRHNVIGRKLLDPRSVVEDHAKLVPVSVQFLFGQIDTGESRHIGDVDIDGHAPMLGVTHDVSAWLLETQRFLHECSDLASDLVAYGSDDFDGLPVRIGKFPVDVALAREVGTCISTSPVSYTHLTLPTILRV